MPSVVGPDPESAPVTGPVSSAPVAGPVAGLFGKLPAHGDFVRRGWGAETGDAIDSWLTAAVHSARSGRDDDDIAAWMHAAPLWRGYVPPGQLGPHALHLAVAPSVDGAGRLFPVAAGIAGGAGAAWAHAEGAGGAVDAAIYDALAGRADADATVAAIAGSVDVRASSEAPELSAWWLRSEGAPAFEAETVDAALLERLLGEGQSGGGA